MKTKFPQVFKSKHGEYLNIVYKDRVEIYKLQKVETKKMIDTDNPDCNYDYEDVLGKGWNAHHEISVMKNGGGFTQIHPTTDDEYMNKIMNRKVN